MNRSRKMISLALNKSLAAKINTFKKQNMKRKIKHDDDDNFVPKKIQQQKNTNKIVILSNIVVRGLQNTNSEETISEKQHIVDEILDEIIINCTNISEQRMKNAHILKIFDEIVDKVFEQVFLKSYTKRGELRKRKKHTFSVEERKRMKLDQHKTYHNVKQVCSNKCKKNCQKKINPNRRVRINEQYWNLTETEKKTFCFIMFHNVQQSAKQPMKQLQGGLKLYIIHLRMLMEPSKRYAKCFSWEP